MVKTGSVNSYWDAVINNLSENNIQRSPAFLSRQIKQIKNEPLDLVKLQQEKDKKLVEEIKQSNEYIKKTQEGLSQILEKFGLRIKLVFNADKKMTIVEFYNRSNDQLVTTMPLVVALEELSLNISFDQQILGSLSGKITEEIM